MARNGQNVLAMPNLKTKQCQAFFIDVSPEMATDWLENNNNINRVQRLGAIEKYLRDRLNDAWLTTHEAIAFDWNGEMIDGQHRSQMIVESGRSLETLIVLGLDPEVRMVVGTAIPRRPHDILKLLGFVAGPWDVAVVRQMINSINRRATMTEIVRAYKKYEKRAKIVMAMFPDKRRKLTMSPTLAPMARALETYQEADIKTFAEILYDGMGRRNRKGDWAVTQLHDWLITLPAIGGNADRA